MGRAEQIFIFEFGVILYSQFSWTYYFTKQAYIEVVEAWKLLKDRFSHNVRVFYRRNSYP